MGETERKVLERILNNTKEILKILDKINHAQEETLSKLDE